MSYLIVVRLMARIGLPQGTWGNDDIHVMGNPYKYCGQEVYTL